MDDAVGSQVPAVLGGIGGDALEQAVVIPTEREQHVPGAFHGLGRLIKAVGSLIGTRGASGRSMCGY